MPTNFIYWLDQQATTMFASLTINSTTILTEVDFYLRAFILIAVVSVGYMLILGYGKQAFHSFLGFFIKFILVSIFLVSAEKYNTTIKPAAREIPNYLVASLNCDPKTEPTCSSSAPTFSRAYLMGVDEKSTGLLDYQFSAFFTLAKAAWNKASILDNNMGMWFLSFFLIITSTLFTVSSGFILTAVWLFNEVLILFGPLFIAAAVLKSTQNFFVKWVELMIKLILIEVMVIAMSVFISTQLLAFLASLDTNFNYPTLAAVTDYQPIYHHITLANVTMLCCIFLLGLLILRLILPVAHELSQGLKLASRSVIHAGNQFFGADTQVNNNQHAVNNANANASFTSLFKNSATNNYQQSYHQSIAQTHIAAAASQGAAMVPGSTNIHQTKINSVQNNHQSNNYSSLQQYKMAYQRGFRGI